MTDDNLQILDADVTQDLDQNEGQLFITEEICAHWNTSSTWAAALATVGFIGFGLMLIGGFFMLISSFTKDLVWPAFFVIASFSVWLYFLSQRLYRYSVKVKEAGNYSDWEAMEQAFSDLKSTYTLYGGFTVLMVCIFICVFLFGLLMAFSSDILNHASIN